MSAHPTPELRHLLTYPRSTLVLIFASAALLLYTFLFYPAYPTTTGKTLAGWTWTACSSHNGFLHGRLVPLFATTMLILAWDRNRTQPISPSYRGLFLLSILLKKSLRPSASPAPPC